MGIKRIIIGWICFSTAVFAAEYTLKTPLKERVIDWKATVIKRHQNGHDEEVLFTQKIDGKDVAVKRYLFSNTGVVVLEEDLTTVEENGVTKIVPDGPSITFYAPSSVESVKEYNKGVQDGLFIKYTKEGVEEIVAHYKNGLLSGSYVEYAGKNLKKQEGFFIDGKLEGEVWRYHPSGKRAQKGSYVNGLLEGISISWYESGVIESYSFYSGGLLNDTDTKAALIFYSEDGVVKATKRYKKGLKHGDHLTFFSNGAKKSYETYIDDKLHGKSVEYEESGKIVASGEFCHGVAIFEHIRKSSNGKILYIANYDQEGKLLEDIKEFNEEGLLIAKYFKENEQFEKEFITYYDNGKIKQSLHFKGGKLHGKAEEFFESGEYKYRGHYVEGIHIGEHSTWYENGQLVRKEVYIDGKLEGDLKVYFEDGILATSAFYKNGELHGKYLSHTPQGDLVFEANYCEGKLDGKVIKYFDKGKISDTQEYKNGLLHGTSTHYASDEGITAIENYKDGKLDGEAVGYYQSGNMSYQNSYKEGLLVGAQYKYFDEKQKRVAVCENYNSEGKREGEQKAFFHNGAICHRCSYQNDRLHGLKEIYNEEGEVLERAYYDQGDLDGPHYSKDKNGSISEGTFNKGMREGILKVFYPLHPKYGLVQFIEGYNVAGSLHGPLKKFHINGTLAENYQCEKGFIEGKATYYNSDGVLLKEAYFEKGLLHGETKEFYKDGKLQRVMHYAQGKPMGEEIAYFHDGSIKHTKNYEEGLLHGECKNFNENGILIFEAEYKNGLKHGIFNKYFDDGRKKLFQRYEEDHRIEKQSFPK